MKFYFITMLICEIISLTENIKKEIKKEKTIKGRVKLLSISFIINLIPIINIFASIINIIDLFSKTDINAELDEKGKVLAEKLYNIKIGEICMSDELYSIYKLLLEIEKKYKDIMNQKSEDSLYKETANNRIEYILIFIKENKKNNSLYENKKEIMEVLTTTNKLFDELLIQIERKDLKIKNNISKYLKDKMKQSENDANSMINDLREIRNNEK